MLVTLTSSYQPSTTFMSIRSVLFDVLSISCKCSSMFAASNDLPFSFEQLLPHVDFLEYLSFIDG